MTDRVAFDIWARDEISRLRREAEALERALERYLDATGQMSSRTSHVSGRISPDSKPSISRPRISKYEAVFVKWAEATGESGLTIDDMDRIAREIGRPIDRNNLRSVVYNQKKAGRVTADGDRYFWKNQEVSASPDAETLFSQS